MSRRCRWARREQRWDVSALKKIKNIVSVFGLASLLAACNPAVSVRPLYQDDDVKGPTKDPRILGEWISPDLDNEKEAKPIALKWKVTENSSGGYDVEMLSNADREPAEQHVTQYKVRLVPIEGKLFFDGEFQKSGKNAAGMDRQELPLGIVPAHMIGQVLVEPDFLVTGLPAASWVRDNTPEAFREFMDIGHDKEVSVITGTTQELRRFMAQQAENGDCFAYVTFLCRPDTDCIAASYEYVLKKNPQNEEAARDLISYDLENGNYGRAAELLRTSAEAAPEDISRRKALGNALLLNREYAEAQREFSRAQQLQPDDAEAQRGIGWSYFLEGNFEKAAEAFQKAMALPEGRTADPALLAYISLKRSGKAAEAEALLSKEIAGFIGDADDQMLLLFYGGRVTTSSYRIAEEAQDRGRAEFFLGEQSVAVGNSALAPLNLWQCVEKAKRDALYGAAAKVELEQLSGPDQSE
jgi:tetratricopeptide (TPR) repeat protein